jgi:predicted transcriptional regulator
MSEELHDEEIRQQAKAEAGAGKVVPGSGRRGKPRRMAQMVSVRLDGELIGKLRIVARKRNVTLSDLLREGAVLIVKDEYARAQPQTNFTISGAQEAFHETMSERAFAVH